MCFAFPHRLPYNICAKTILCNHQGKKDVLDHLETNGHKTRAKASQSQTKINFCATSNDSLLQKTASAEVTMSVLTATENIPLAFYDKLSPAISQSFPDSPTASKYRSRATKATCMLNGAVSPYLLKSLTDAMKVQPFSISIDGSNETVLEKMNPMMVRIFDINVGRVVNRFLNMCTTSGATAEIIYNAMDAKLSKLLDSDEPWMHCTSIGVDNTSTNIGIQNSLKTRVTALNEAIYFSDANVISFIIL